MHPCPSARAGVASARRLRTRGPALQDAGIRLDALRARGAAPLSSSRQGWKPEGPRQAERRLGSRQPGPGIAGETPWWVLTTLNADVILFL